MAALEIRKDRSPTVLRKLAKAESDVRVARRLLAIAKCSVGHEPGGGSAICWHGPADAARLGDPLP